jgi:hypothetical protein
MNDVSIERLLVLFALMGVAAPAAAQPAGPPGRLFFTPAQRAALDVARTQRARALLANEKPEQEAAPVPQTITYGGMVRRSDGKSTVWINNQPVNDREPLGGAIVGQVRPDGSVTLQVPQSGRSVNLKPGQSVELLSGTVEEGFSRRLEVSKPEPKPTVKPAPEGKAARAATPDSADAERARDERQQSVIEEAVSRALQETAAARPGAAPGSAPLK